ANATSLSGGAISVSTAHESSTTNEIQRITIPGPPTGGAFALRLANQTTDFIPYNATAAQLQSALQSLSNVGAGNCTVTLNGPFDWSVEFHGALTGRDLPLLVGDVTAITGVAKITAS